LDRFVRDRDRTGAKRFCPAILLFVRSEPPAFVSAIPMVPPLSSPTATEAFLDRWRAEQ
jgi:hypothetical protein